MDGKGQCPPPFLLKRRERRKEERKRKNFSYYQHEEGKTATTKRTKSDSSAKKRKIEKAGLGSNGRIVNACRSFYDGKKKMNVKTKTLKGGGRGKRKECNKTSLNNLLATTV